MTVIIHDSNQKYQIYFKLGYIITNGDRDK